MAFITHNFMKHFFYFLVFATLLSCSSEVTSTIAKKDPRTLKPKEKAEKSFKIDYNLLNASIKTQTRFLDSVYGRTPYYSNFGGRKMFIVMKGELHPDSGYYDTRFNGRFGYGIVNDSLQLILPCKYDKIYNPNITVLNCLEIKKNTLVGLFNYATHEILEPEFDYISPSSEKPDQIAYGHKNGSWFKIQTQPKFKTEKADFSPIDVFKKLAFDVQQPELSVFYNTYNMVEEEGPSYGTGVVFTPSYLERLDLIPEVCEDIILASEKDKADWGTADETLNTDSTRSITDKLVSFFTSFYQKGLDGRGYAVNSKKLIVFNKEQKTFNMIDLNSDDPEYNNFCREQSVKFISDTVIEVMENRRAESDYKERYDFENYYAYKWIQQDGKIVELKNKRYYNFTKHAQIDESYLKGCFAKWIDVNEGGDSNVWVSQHLTLEDLEVMINEIYAEYGFKFKTQKWNDYFHKFTWYAGEFDNVDDKLSPIDKKNIEFLSNYKAKMKGKENDFVKKHKDVYWAAG
jgi:hypothetical protein